MKTFNRIWQLLFPLILAVLVMRPILGNVWYPMHDTTHVARLFLMQETINRGEFPPLWAEGINNGLGYPLFHFYAPFFYYIASAFTIFFGYFAGLKLAILLFIFFGLVGMMRLVSPWGRGAMLLAATLLATSPYVAVDLYVRGAYSEVIAIFLFPLLLATWQDLSTRKSQVLAGAITAFFLMSHNLIPMLAFPIVVTYVLYQNRTNLRAVILPSLITLLIASCYLLPLFFERNFVQADEVAKTSNYAQHFVMPWQLWNSTWGFGGSAAGVEDGMSFKIGKVQLALALIGSFWCLFKSKRAWQFVIFTIFTLFMTTPYSRDIWDKISLLQLAQFPWRYLALAAPLLAIVGSSIVNLIPTRSVRAGVILVTVTLLLLLNLKYFTPQSTFPAQITDFTNQNYLDTVADIIPEYMPRWMKVKIEDEVPIFTHKEGATTIARAYYPTWQVMLDGQKVPTYPDANGLLTIDNPYASDNIVYTQTHTRLQYLGYLLTLLGVSLTLYWLTKK